MRPGPALNVLPGAGPLVAPEPEPELELGGVVFSDSHPDKPNSPTPRTASSNTTLVIPVSNLGIGKLGVIPSERFCRLEGTGLQQSPCALIQRKDFTT